MATTLCSIQEAFSGKSCEFVGEWLEKNNLQKLKPIFEGR
jgi:hypothetical protein